MEDLEILKTELRRAEAGLFEARKRLLEAQIKSAKYQVGEIVKVKYRRQPWADAVIREVEPQSTYNHDNKSWYKVSFRSVSGDWRKNSCYIFSEEDMRVANGN